MAFILLRFVFVVNLLLASGAFGSGGQTFAGKALNLLSAVPITL